MRRWIVGLAVLVVLVRSASGQGIEDVDPPVLLDMWVEPAMIECSFSDQVVTVHWELSDDLTGHRRSDVAFFGPSSGQRVDAFAQASTLVSGDALHGFYEDDITFPQYSEIGVWRPGSLWVGDEIGNNWQKHWGDLTSYLASQGIDATVTVGPVPEPSTLILLTMGALALIPYAWRRRRWR